MFRKKFYYLIGLLLTLTSFIIPTISLADNDGNTVQIGIEAVENYSTNPIYGTNACVSGLNDIVNDPNTNWGMKYHWSNSDVWEKDYRSVSLGGNDYRLTDDVDLAAYSGHGYSNPGFLLTSEEDEIWARRSKMRLGDRDLEWFLTYTCNFLNEYYAIGKIMNGLHMVCGYHSDMTITTNGGSKFAYYAKRGNSVRWSWYNYALDTQPSGNKAATFYHTSNKDDRLWGYGAVANDPTPFSQDNSGYHFNYITTD